MVHRNENAIFLIKGGEVTESVGEDGVKKY